MEREASTSQSVESVIVDLPWRVSLSFNVSQIGRRGSQSFFVRSSAWERCEAVGTVSHYFEVTRPIDLKRSGLPVLRSVPAAKSEAARPCGLPRRSLSLSCQAGIFQLRASSEALVIEELR